MAIKKADIADFQEIESHFENAKMRILKMAVNQFHNGEISEDTFCEYLNRGDLVEMFIREYMGVNPDNPLFRVLARLKTF
jgi:hypothetical protein